MNSSILKKLTYASFISLALFPLVEENVNSISIILACVFVIINRVLNKERLFPTKKIWLLTTLFWLFAFREIILLEPNLDLIIRYLPFLVFPLLFYYKPNYINASFLIKTVKVFQFAVFLKVILYLLLFFETNSIESFFYISNENIPFFRNYIFTHSKIVVHPTYFSAFLLFSFTFSIFRLSKKKSIQVYLINGLNIVFTLFFIFLLSAKIIVLLIPITLIFFLILTNKKTRIIGTLLFFALSFLVLLSPLKNGLKERFYEIKQEVNKPIDGNYYNSTNVRIAILKCSIELTTKMPVLGYGNRLQLVLNQCYKENNNSDFYKENVYNTHNFYFYTLLYGGWLFFTIFLMYVFFLIKITQKNSLVLLLLLQILIINLTENFLYRQYGIVLFIYFVSLLLIDKEGKQIKNI